MAIGRLLVVCALAAGLAWLGAFAFRPGRRRGATSGKLVPVAERADNAIVLTSREGLVEWVNPGFTRLTGATLAEVAGQSPVEAFQGAGSDGRIAQRIKEGIAGRAHFSVDLPCADRKQRRYWLVLSFAPVLGDNNQLLQYIVVGTDITPYKRSEEELSRLNRRNELLLSAAGEGIFGVDLLGKISFVNPAAARMSGWNATEVVGKPASTLIHQLRITTLPGGQDDHFMAAAYHDGTVLAGDTDLFRRKEGTPYPVEYVSKPIVESQRLVGTVVVFHDITDRKQTEALRSRQARQSALRADIGFALTTSESLPGTLNRCAQAIVKHLEGAFARIWTLNPEEDMLELQASAGLYTHLHGQHSRIPVGASKVGTIARERVPVLAHDLASDPDIMDREWVEREGMVGFAGFPLLVQNRLVGVVAMFSQKPMPPDALELLGAVADSIAQGIVRKTSEAKLNEQAALLDKAQDAILVLDLGERCIYWNKSAERLYGWAAREVLGRSIESLIYRDSASYQQSRSATMIRGEWLGECRHVTRGDEAVIVESRWTLVRDDAGQPQSILIVNTNISEKKTIESQLLRTQRMESIGTLAGGIAHDLNNVLAPILMSVQILRDKFKDPQSHRMLSILESSAKRGADMVKQVLTFARGVDGERMLLQTRHLVKEVAKMLGETLPKSIQVRLQLAEDLWPIMGDATQLHQVMVNLTVNARDAMPAGGVLTLSAENVSCDPATMPASLSPIRELPKPGKYVCLKVSDTGTGISPDVLDKIFEPFFTTKEVGKGTGLGLATVLGIVKSHGGFLQVQTELDKGTTFLIHLPAAEHAQAHAGEGALENLPGGSGQLILTVDDEATVLTMTKETLEHFGYRVLTARDGTEAVAVYSAHRSEIKGVVTDMLMPFMDGPATIRALRKLDPDVRIVAASGLMDRERIRESTGMDDLVFLAKPYSAEKLLTTIHDLLSQTN
ncbi:MAG: PAS domain S-box protein [Verrucomicrobia bacterium]|nr:PAS domain S-box protein [Verrucomicrobiota bacterium]